MRLLFNMDHKDYKSTQRKIYRPSARSIIIKNGKVAMIHCLKYDYYKFPGGGIEKDESIIEALIRETKEESGLVIITDTIKEYGYVYRALKAKEKDYDVFIQDNYYYFCEVKDEMEKQNLDKYESDEKFTLEFVNPLDAICTNLNKEHPFLIQSMANREANVLKLLIKEKYF